MKLGMKTIRELKDKKISIEDLYEKFFYTQKDGVNVENILKLLNENICSFGEIVDKFKGMKDEDDYPCLYKLLENNTILLKRIVDIDTTAFKALIDAFKSIKDAYNNPCLYKLLANQKLFENLIQNNRLTKDDLRYMLNRIDREAEVDKLNENTSLLRYIVDNDLFKDIVDKFKNTKSRKFDSCLHNLLKNKKLFEELIKNNKLNIEELKYLLESIDRRYELDKLCRNASLAKKILNEFVLNKEDVDRFNAMIENNDQCKYYEIHTIFDLIEDHNKDNEEILKLNTLNKCVCSFDFDETQRIALAEILKDSEVAQNRLIQIIDNNLQDQYDFESLKSLLTKDEAKKKIKLNF